MNKDVIYIDVEDDITAIIGKVKASKEKIVALVPPKRVGVLQSAVNLQLLARAANQKEKHLVLISNNSALMALAAAAKIPVAKNLQSKPELAEISAFEVDDGDDIIDGAQLPVGELERTADQAAGAGSTSSAIDAALSENAAEEATTRATPPKPGQPLTKPRAKSGVKVPNFNSFRKRIVLIAGGVVLLIAFFVWAIFFAPRATVVISARTTDASANVKVNLSSSGSTGLLSNTIKAVSKQQKQDVNISFDATGKKDIGDKAKGTVSFSTGSIDNLGTTIPAGTQLTSNTGRVFTTDSAVTITIQNYKGAPTGVTASQSGSSYNGVSGSMSGAPSGISATLTGSTAGGTDKTISVVTADDVQKATDQLAQQNSDTIKKQLTDQLDDSAVVIDATFKTDRSQVQPSPAVDQEATGGKAKLTGSVTYSLLGVEKSQINRYLDEYFKKQLEGKDDQRVYDNGKDKATFANVAEAEGGFSANIVANAKVGPRINDDQIKSTAKGKRYGEIQSTIEEIPGVDDVDIKFWPFWVNTAPNDEKRITVEFKLNESK